MFQPAGSLQQLATKGNTRFVAGNEANGHSDTSILRLTFSVAAKTDREFNKLFKFYSVLNSLY
jgi:hypothetical protein